EDEAAQHGEEGQLQRGRNPRPEFPQNRGPAEERRPQVAARETPHPSAVLDAEGTVRSEIAAQFQALRLPDRSIPGRPGQDEQGGISGKHAHEKEDHHRHREDRRYEEQESLGDVAHGVVLSPRGAGRSAYFSSHTCSHLSITCAVVAGTKWPASVRILSLMR